MTSIEVVATYDSRSVVGDATNEDPLILEDGFLLRLSRVVAVYRRSRGEPWEFSLVRIIAQNGSSAEDGAILVRSSDDDWPDWLARFVDDNIPKDGSDD